MIKNSFINGFEQRSEAVSKPVKKHVIVLYWAPEHDDAKKTVDRLRIKHPTVKVKVIRVEKGASLKAHNVKELPTVLLLKNGHEIDRVAGTAVKSDSVLSQLFRRAYS